MTEKLAKDPDTEVELRYRFRAQAQGRHRVRLSQMSCIIWCFGIITTVLVVTFIYVHFMRIGIVAELLKNEPWLWAVLLSLPVVTAGISFAGMIFKSILEEMGAFSSMIIDIPTGVEKGLSRFIGGGHREFDRAHGVLTLGQEIKQTEERLGEACLRAQEATIQALVILDPYGGLEGMKDTYERAVALGTLLEQYMDARGEIITAHEMKAATLKIEDIAAKIKLYNNTVAAE